MQHVDALDARLGCLARSRRPLASWRRPRNALALLDLSTDALGRQAELGRRVVRR